MKRENFMSIASVLFVDDEVPFVEALSKRLGKRNIKVTPAFSGRQALELLKSSSDIEVVILDVKMPGLDGIATLREVKHMRPLVEVVMLTGHATVESAIEGMKLGAYDYLMKPCEIDVLVAKVSEAAAKKRKHEEKILQARLKEIVMRRV
jgi:DNA-binding NtrC family response regulator